MTVSARQRVLFSGPLGGWLSWWLCPAFIRKCRPRSDTLFAGPWVGEFGWELMNWQGWVRRLAGNYKRVIVCCREPSAALYRDVATEFVFHSIDGVPNCHHIHDVKNPDEVRCVWERIPSGADHVRPIQYVPQGAQSFVRFGAREDGDVVVLCHARGRSLDANRNWGQAEWDTCVRELEAHGLRVGAIGLRSSTLPLTCLHDYRDKPLEETMNIIASARLVIGPSSGPMHLASLCGTPHLVWGDRRTYSMKKTSRDKYESWWNPLGTPVTMIDEYGYDIPVSAVVSEVRRNVEGKDDADA